MSLAMIETVQTVIAGLRLTDDRESDVCRTPARPMVGTCRTAKQAGSSVVNRWNPATVGIVDAPPPVSAPGLRAAGYLGGNFGRLTGTPRPTAA